MTRCETCFYWPAKIFGTRIYGEGGPNTDGSASECRRRAPVADSGERRREKYPHPDRVFPVTSAGDYCGDYLIDQDRARFLLSKGGGR